MKKKLKISLLVWYYLPDFIKSVFPQRFVTKNNKSLLKLLRISKNNLGKVIIIGACDGLSFDDLLPELLNEAQIKHPNKFQILFVEPVPYYFEKLKKNIDSFFPNLSNTIFLNKAIHKTKTEEIIYSVNPTEIVKHNLPDWLNGCSTFFRDDLVNKFNIKEEQIISTKVNCQSFDKTLEVFTNLGIAKFWYLQIDTEGYDAEILKMIDFKKYHFDVIKFEKINLSTADLKDIQKKLEIQYYLFNFSEDIVAINKQ